ncbi:hypothetical protein OC845_005696 [Tilletia horrida]|nr:hypothetical protein OC845_005696 [Tilletia horrida]
MGTSTRADQDVAENVAQLPRKGQLWSVSRTSGPGWSGSSQMATGPMPVSTWMTRCLLDPVHGYYASAESSTSPIFGAKGDFVTSPDISQVFGELLAIWFLTRFQNVAQAHDPAVDAPLRARLVEFGPGRGALLSDMLRTFSNFPSLLKALTAVDLVETSPFLRSQQKSVLQAICTKLGKKLVVEEDGTGANDAYETTDERELRLRWYDRPESVPVRKDVWTAVVAHEFFDALPINIFERTPNGWREVYIDAKASNVSASGVREERSESGITVLRPPTSSPLIPRTNLSLSGAASKPEFRFVLSPGPTPLAQLLAASNPRFETYSPGTRLEVSAEAWAAGRAFGRLVSGQREEDAGSGGEVGGAGLIVDYGGEQAFSNSFRAFKTHKLVNPLEDPGKQDLTANVDFAHVRGAVEAGGAQTHPLATQQSFLLHLGLQPRLEVLLRSAPTEERKKAIESAAARLVEGGKVGMGETFKVLGATAPAAAGSREEVYPFAL